MKHLFITAITLFLLACSSSPKYAYESQIQEEQLNAFMVGKPAAYRSYFDVYLRQGARNSVLNEMRIGLLAFQQGDWQLSAWLFDRAINKIETIYANNKTAKKARSKFKKEELKDFKGEPYERAMAYFYRGLIYLQQDDYENARASMLGGLLQDAWAEEQTYEQDFASHYYLAGWASYCNGNQSQATDYFAQAKKLNNTLTQPDGSQNLLIVATSGQGPLKYHKGEYNEQLAFDTTSIQSASGIARPHMSLDQSPIHFVTTENIHWQATTRGGRTIDVINEGKAVFKQNTDEMGTALTSTGSSLMNAGLASNNRDLGNAGAVMALFGLVSKGFSKATKPTADIRYWDNLPAFIYTNAANKQQVNAAETQFSYNDILQQNTQNLSSKFEHLLQLNSEQDTSCDLLYIHDQAQALPFRHINQ